MLNLNIVSNNIMNLRKATLLSRKELAMLLGVTRNEIVSWENMSKAPEEISIRKLLKIANIKRELFIEQKLSVKEIFQAIEDGKIEKCLY